MKKKATVSFGMVAATLGCLFIIAILCSLFGPLFQNAPEIKPESSDVTGIYLIDEFTKEYLKSKGYQLDGSVSIELAADGQLKMKNIPDLWWCDFEGEKHEYASGQGVWELYKNGAGYWEILSYWESGLLAEEGRGGGNFHISGKQAPFELWLSIYSPDYSHRMIFVKTGTQ